jgi:hypothetical protein
VDFEQGALMHPAKALRVMKRQSEEMAACHFQHFVAVLMQQKRSPQCSPD